MTVTVAATWAEVDAGFRALLDVSPPLVVHRGKVPSSTTYPYVLLSSRMPRPAERGLSRVPHGTRAEYRTTVVGLTEQSVRVIGQRVIAALEHQRVSAAGHVVGRVENVPNDQPIIEDQDVAVGSSGAHPFYAVMDWRFIYSPT